MDYIIKETNQLKEIEYEGKSNTHREKVTRTAALEPVTAPYHYTMSGLNDEVSPSSWAVLTGANLPDDLSHGPPVLEQKFKGELGFSLILFKILSKVDQNKDKSLRRNHKRNVKHFIMFGLTIF